MIFVDKSEAKGRRKSSFSCAAQNERFRRSESERLSGFFFDYEERFEERVEEYTHICDNHVSSSLLQHANLLSSNLFF